VSASERGPDDPKGSYLTQQEVIADSWIMLFAGHETSANITNYCLLFLAIELEKQAHLQRDIDSVIGIRPPEEWTYETDLANLWNSMVGAAINETLRLMPPIIDIPKVVRDTPQPLNYEDKKVVVPAGTVIHISAVGLHRNPRYWPHKPSKVSKRSHDLDDWVPERWLQSSKTSAPKKAQDSIEEAKPEIENENTTSFDTTGPNGLFIPPKGAFMPFSEGARACPGKRFAQIEITGVLAAVFKDYSVELDVSEWASNEQVLKMGTGERQKLYAKAMKKADDLIKGSQSEIFLTMRGHYPVRFVRRGGERFASCFTV
jgi:cytochrome P450